MILGTGPVAFANSKQRLSTIVISRHHWTSQQPVCWSEAGWLSHPSASSQSLRVPAATMLAASSRVTVVSFGNFSLGPVDSSNLFATPRETAAKLSAVRLYLKRRVSRAPLHSACSRSRKWAVCFSNDWVAHARSWPIFGERHTASCLHSQKTLHFLLGTLIMLAGKERG